MLKVTLLGHGRTPAVAGTGADPAAAAVSVGGHTTFRPDCGEGTQVGLRRYGVELRPRLSAVLLTHHQRRPGPVLGLPGLLQTLGSLRSTAPGAG